jgi:hypothetical protein
MKAFIATYKGGDEDKGERRVTIVAILPATAEQLEPVAVFVDSDGKLRAKTIGHFEEIDPTTILDYKD